LRYFVFSLGIFLKGKKIESSELIFINNCNVLNQTFFEKKKTAPESVFILVVALFLVLEVGQIAKKNVLFFLALLDIF
jgi:hypothetical protein